MSISYLFFISSFNSTPSSYLSYSASPPHSTHSLPLTPIPTPSPPAAPPPPFECLLIKSDNSSFHCSKFLNTCPHDHLCHDCHDCHDHHHLISVIMSFIIFDIDIIILIIASINHHALYEE